MKFGILGGTFDPIHLGHLRAAEEIGEKLGLEKVFLIPAASPPHKRDILITAFRHRVAMARLGAEHSPLLEVLDLEGRREGPSFSIETLKELHRIYQPDPNPFFILGADAFVEIRSWRDYIHLLDYAHFVIIPRSGIGFEDIRPVVRELGLGRPGSEGEGVFAAPSGKKLIPMIVTPLGISSTTIRGLAGEGRSLRFLVPDNINRYIQEKGLYRDHGIP